MPHAVHRLSSAPGARRTVRECTLCGPGRRLLAPVVAHLRKEAPTSSGVEKKAFSAKPHAFFTCGRREKA